MSKKEKQPKAKKAPKPKKEAPKSEPKAEAPKKEEKPKQESLAKIRKQMDKNAIDLVHMFIGKYLELDEKDDKGHEANEEMLIEGLYNIYDPAEETPPGLEEVKLD